jgi:hypothetical protein
MNLTDNAGEGKRVFLSDAFDPVFFGKKVF